MIFDIFSHEKKITLKMMVVQEKGPQDNNQCGFTKQPMWVYNEKRIEIRTNKKMLDLRIHIKSLRIHNPGQWKSIKKS
jgi:hypothetical protein